jgi:hypothetical protein
MTNIIKQTLIEKREVIGEALQALTAQKNELILKRAEELFKEVLKDFPQVSLGISYGDTIYFNVDKKEILSINSRSWVGNADHYLNTYSTNIDSEFEYKRLIFNGRIAEILYKGGMQLCINEIFVEDGLLKVYKEEEKQLHQENSVLRSEIARIEKEEAEERKAKALENFFEGNEVTLPRMTDVATGRGRYDAVTRVVKLKCINKNVSGKKVTIEFTCLDWKDAEREHTLTVEGIQTKYLLDQLI